MAKLTKTALKSIVKECLVEILAEGIGSTNAINESKKTPAKKPVKRPAPTNKKFDQAVSQTVGSITDDDIMREILADTAKGTLQEQLKHERSKPGAVVQSGLSQDQSSAGINLDGIFSSASENWSSLAFTEKKN